MMKLRMTGFECSPTFVILRAITPPPKGMRPAIGRLSLSRYFMNNWWVSQSCSGAGFFRTLQFYNTKLYYFVWFSKWIFQKICIIFSPENGTQWLSGQFGSHVFLSFRLFWRRSRVVGVSDVGCGIKKMPLWKSLLWKMSDWRGRLTALAVGGLYSPRRYAAC